MTTCVIQTGGARAFAIQKLPILGSMYSSTTVDLRVSKPTRGASESTLAKRLRVACCQERYSCRGGGSDENKEFNH
jgi:hypothetical protein